MLRDLWDAGSCLPAIHEGAIFLISEVSFHPMLIHTNQDLSINSLLVICLRYMSLVPSGEGRTD